MRGDRPCKCNGISSISLATPHARGSTSIKQNEEERSGSHGQQTDEQHLLLANESLGSRQDLASPGEYYSGTRTNRRRL